MANPAFAERTARVVDPRNVEILDVMGPTIQLLTAPGEPDDAPCIMRGTIPPGVFVPLHSHPDPETFIHVAGDLEAVVQSADGFTWTRILPGDVFHVPGGAKHAFRNQMRDPAVSIVVSTPRLGRFFREIGERMNPGVPPSPPSPDRIRHFLETAERYGYWNATQEENAQIGLRLPPIT
jgi:quercetin dioxygenase-like cupin family protein